MIKSFKKKSSKENLLIYSGQAMILALMVYFTFSIKYYIIYPNGNYIIAISNLIALIVVYIFFAFAIDNLYVFVVKKKYLDINNEYIIILSSKDKNGSAEYYYWKEIEKLDIAITNENDLVLEITLVNKIKIGFQIDEYWWLKKQSVKKLKRNYKNFINTYSHIDVFLDKFENRNVLLEIAKDNGIVLKPFN